MSAPPKPWETSRNALLNQPQSTSYTSSPQLSGMYQQRPTVYPGMYNNTASSLPQTAAPRIPPRPAGSTVPGRSMGQPYGAGSYGYNSSYSPYGMRSSYGGYGGYGGGGYGGYGSYGGLGGMSSYGGYGGYGSSYGSPYSSLTSYGGGYGGYGMGGQIPPMPGQDNSFIQMAEESSRPAFQSLESMVHAFGSVSMMLESTFFAIHSSFRAVLGVAENFGRMRGMLAQVFSALTIFKAVRWAYHQLLVLLGVRKRGSTEKIWAEATADSGLATIGGTQGSEARKSSAWPIVMFMSLVMGGPYLIWKLLRSVLANVPENEQTEDPSNEPWMVGKAPCMIGKASFNYHAGSADELSFNVGDVIAMAPTEKQPYQADGWLLARKIGDASGAHINGPSPIGLVPSNHFKTLYNKAKKISTATTSPDAMPVINEEPLPSTSSTTIPPADLEVSGEILENDLPLKNEDVEILSQTLTNTEEQ